MRPITKITLMFCALFAVALFSVVTASDARQNISSVTELCKKARRVEILQNQQGDKFELNFLSRREFNDYTVLDHFDFVWGDQDCIESTGNCGKVKSDTYIVILSE